MSNTYLQEQLAQAVRVLDLSLSVGQKNLLLTYLAQMQRWNKTYNLTAIRDPQQMLVQHIVDSLAVVRPIYEALGHRDAATIADIGSGGGLPGVVLAVAAKQWTVHCVDAVEKKTAFVRQMAGALGLQNLKAVHSRVEELPPLEADIVVSRAFASLVDFATLAGKHVAETGKLLAMKGRLPEDEIAQLHAQGQWKVHSIQELEVPQLEAQRCLVWISRQGIR